MATPQRPWGDPECPWIAKLARAQQHITDLRERVDKYRDNHVRVEEVGTGYRGKVELVLHMDAPIPIDLSTIAGDAVHNLRSALDTLAFELARLYCGGDVPPELVRRPSFPICSTKAKYQEFFGDRKTVFGPAAVAALRSVAPGWRYVQAAQFGVEPSRQFEDEAVGDPLYLLNELWNVDKHRRLHVAVFWPDLIWWGSNAETSDHGWSWGTPPFVDGSVIGTITAASDGSLPSSIVSELEFRLIEPGLEHRDFVKCLQGIHNHISFWLLPTAWRVHDDASKEG